MNQPINLENQIKDLTAWLRTEKDMTAGRIALLLRRRGVDSKTLFCVKIFPDREFPESGIVITPSKEIYLFSFNASSYGANMKDFDGWTNLTDKYMEHQWRDEILTGLVLLEKEPHLKVVPRFRISG